MRVKDALMLKKTKT